QGRETGRPARRAANEIRSRVESQDGQGTRHYLPGGAACHRRRGDRVSIRRRDFITFLGGAAAAWPLAARAQQRVLPVVGYLNAGSRSSDVTAPFRQGLKDVGYVEGQNVKVEYQWAEGQYDRLAGMVADMVARRVTVIAAGPSPAA